VHPSRVGGAGGSAADPVIVAALLGGLACAALGGELFVRSAVGIAAWARVPAGVIGATVAAFATSSPEVSVAIGAAVDGRPEIALGDGLGSNVVNVGLVLGLALLVGPIAAPRQSTRRDMPAAVFVPLATVVLALDGRLSRTDAMILMTTFAAWLVLTTIAARRERSAAVAVLAERSHGRSIVEMLVGLLLLVAAGWLIVYGAKGVGDEFGLDAFVVGATLVAIGTSTPELATTLIARIRQHSEIGLGTVVGSNIYNGGFVVALAALIQPISFSFREVGAAIAFGLALVALLLSARGSLGRRLGLLFLVTYGGYVAVLLTIGPAPQ
jgi:cation:H+ antiporter